MSENVVGSDLPVLDALVKRRGAAARLEQLGQDVGATVPAVRESLQRLTDLGCRIEAAEFDAVRLAESGWRAWQPYLQHARGRDAPVEVHGTIGSTQDRVRMMLQHLGRAADDAVVLANVQTGGRGRLGRRWAAPAGTAVLLSRGRVHDGPIDDITLNRLMATTAIAVADAIETAAGPGLPALQIHWPNDLLLEGRKLAGILVETFRIETTDLHGSVVGVGINVNLDPDGPAMPPEARGHGIASLRAQGHFVDRLAVAKHVIQALDGAGSTDVAGSWHRRCVLPRGVVRAHYDGHIYAGRVIAADPTDGLVLRCEDGTLAHLPAATTSLESLEGE